MARSAVAMTSKWLVAAWLLMLSLASADAGVRGTDSTGWRWLGFNIKSNVTGQLYISKDACEIRDVLKADMPDFARAQSIYLDGSNAIRPDGITPRKLYSWTTGAHSTDHPYFNNGSAMFEDPDWLNSAMMSMIEEQEVAPVVALSRLHIPLTYLMAELYGIGLEIDPNGTNVTATGPIHALDEGFAAYAGIASHCAPWGYAERAAKEFGTRASCTLSKANEAVVAGFNQAQAAIFAGDVARYMEAADHIVHNVQVSLIQSTIMAAEKAEQAWNALRRGTKAQKESRKAMLHYKHMEAMAIASALAPLIHAHDPSAAQHIADLISDDVQSKYAKKVHQALEATYPHMSITPEMIGTYGSTDTACRKLARKI